MGDGRIFQKNLRASLFNGDLSNKPNICRIYPAGQYLLLTYTKNRISVLIYLTAIA